MEGPLRRGDLLLGRIRSRLTYANVVSTLCLFIVLGGGAWAAGKIDSGDVADNSLKSVDLKDGKGVKGADVAPDSLAGSAIDESALDQVPSAQDAETLDGNFSGQFQRRHTQEWTPLLLNDVFQSSCYWENAGGGYAEASYLRDEDGFVHLQGLVHAIDGEHDSCANESLAIGFLHDGVRPGTNTLFTISSNNKPGRVNVAPSGTVSIEPAYPTASDAKAWVQLDGITFRCAPSGEDGCP
jgi:hypothetical protein